METKYYHAENAGRVIGGLRFTGYGIFSGSLFGVLATSDADQISKLDALSQSPASGVTSISLAEYEGCLKKKTIDSEPLSVSKPPLQPAVPIKGTVGATVVTEPPPPAEDKTDVLMDSKPLESVDAAVRVEEVKGRKP